MIKRKPQDKKDFVDYLEASRVARKAGVQNFKEWMDFCTGRGKFINNKKPDNVPSNPSVIYGKNGTKQWSDWATFLDTDNIANIKVSMGFVSYEECREVCHSMECRTQKEWEEFAKSPLRHRSIPAAPNIVYKNNGWKNWSEFLLPKFLTYEKAKLYVQNLPVEINNVTEWRQYSTHGGRPDFIPANPERVYLKSGWVNWPDFLGTARSPRSLGLREAKRIVHKLHIKSEEDYRERMKSGLLRPSLPKNPSIYYQDQGWISWEDFLGPLSKKEVASYAQAKKLVKQTGIKQASDFHELRRLVSNYDSKNGSDFLVLLFPPELPDNPREYYSSIGDWKNWQEFLLEPKELKDYEFRRKRKTALKTKLESVVEEAITRHRKLVEELGEYDEIKSVISASLNKFSDHDQSTTRQFISKHLTVKTFHTWKALVILAYRAYQRTSDKTVFEIFNGHPLFPENVHAGFWENF